MFVFGALAFHPRLKHWCKIPGRSRSVSPWKNELLLYQKLRRLRQHGSKLVEALCPTKGTLDRMFGTSKDRGRSQGLHEGSSQFIRSLRNATLVIRLMLALTYTSIQVYYWNKNVVITILISKFFSWNVSLSFEAPNLLWSEDLLIDPSYWPTECGG